MTVGIQYVVQAASNSPEPVIDMYVTVIEREDAYQTLKIQVDMSNYDSLNEV